MANASHTDTATTLSLDALAADELESLRAIYGRVQVTQAPARWSPDEQGHAVSEHDDRERPCDPAQRWTIPLHKGRVFAVDIPAQYPHMPARNATMYVRHSGDVRGVDVRDIAANIRQSIDGATTTAAANGDPVVFELVQLLEDALTASEVAGTEVHDGVRGALDSSSLTRPGPQSDTSMGPTSTQADHAAGPAAVGWHEDDEVVDDASDARVVGTRQHTQGDCDVDINTERTVSPSLPPELWQAIFRRLSLQELLPPSCVCKHWRRTIAADIRWQGWLEQRLCTYPGRRAYHPRPKYRQFFTANWLIMSQPARIVLSLGMEHGGRQKHTVEIRSHVKQADGVVVWLERPLMCLPISHQHLHLKRRIRLMPDSRVFFPAGPSGTSFLVARDVHWAELSEPVYLPEKNRGPLKRYE
eukprot:m.66244 g.66244  ORF g.66244 m.66244 type:complete len:415 (-) comp8347_c0_seq2:61-1305(-)